MRLFLIAVILAVAGLGWWQRDALMAKFSPPQPKVDDAVYQWRDANGQMHFSNQKPSGPAKLVQLKPIQTMPGLSQQEIDAAKHGKPAPKGRADEPPPADCDQEDTTELANCIKAQTSVHNVAIDRMEKMMDGKKP